MTGKMESNVSGAVCRGTHCGDTLFDISHGAITVCVTLYVSVSRFLARYHYSCQKS